MDAMCVPPARERLGDGVFVERRVPEAAPWAAKENRGRFSEIDRGAELGL